MRIRENFIDCVYSQHQRKNSREYALRLMYKLPDVLISDLSNVLIIKTKCNYYAVKIRWYYEDRNGNVDLGKIYKKIFDSEFIEISWKDFRDVENIKEHIEKLIGFGNNVLFNMEELE